MPGYLKIGLDDASLEVHHPCAYCNKCGPVSHRTGRACNQPTGSLKHAGRQGASASCWNLQPEEQSEKFYGLCYRACWGWQEQLCRHSRLRTNWFPGDRSGRWHRNGVVYGRMLRPHSQIQAPSLLVEDPGHPWRPLRCALRTLWNTLLAIATGHYFHLLSLLFLTLLS
jgi:hypothetical protein